MKNYLIVEDDKNWAGYILGKFAVDVGAECRVVVSGGQAIEIINRVAPWRFNFGYAVGW